MKKLKAGIFHNPQIRELMKNSMFDEAACKAELSALQSLKSVVTNYLENHRSTEYEKEIKILLKSFRQLETRISTKLNILWSHLDYFPIFNCGDLSEQ